MIIAKVFMVGAERELSFSDFEIKNKKMTVTLFGYPVITLTKIVLFKETESLLCKECKFNVICSNILTCDVQDSHTSPEFADLVIRIYNKLCSGLSCPHGVQSLFDNFNNDEKIKIIKIKKGE